MLIVMCLHPKIYTSIYLRLLLTVLLRSAGGSFPHFVRGRRSLAPRRRAGQAGESGAVHARGRPAEVWTAARPPQLAH